MSDDKSKHARDRNRIDVQQQYELDYWSKKFGVSHAELRGAVEKVGPMAADVEKELRGKRAA